MSQPDAHWYSVRNKVSHVRLRGNVIPRVPVLATRWDPRIRGITVIGGLGVKKQKAIRNSVTCVILKNNRVAGKLDKVFSIANLGRAASRNTARLGGC